MSVVGILRVVGVEWSKLAAQVKVRMVLAIAVVSPFAFAIAMRMQASQPTDTLFGRAITDTGFALPLVVLGFAGLWALPAIASIVGGDLFAAEDRYGTWTTVLTRSRGRSEIFAGKVVTALGFSTVAIVVLTASSIAAGTLVIGGQPLVDLSGTVRSPSDAFVRVALSWLSTLAPTFSFTALAVLISIVTRSSAAGIGLPVVVGLAMQLVTMVDGPDGVRRWLVASAFGAWHGLLSEPPYYRPLVDGTIVSTAYVAICLGIAFRLLRARDIGR